MKNNSISLYIKLIFAYAIIAVLFYIVGGEQLHYREKSSAFGDKEGVLSEVCTGVELCQEFVADAGSINGISVEFTTYGRENSGSVFMTIKEKDTEIIVAQNQVDAALLENGTTYDWTLIEPIENARGKAYQLIITSDCPWEQSPTLYYQEAVGAGTFTVNGIEMPYELYFSVQGKERIWFGTHYWQLVLTVGFILIVYMVWSEIQRNKGHITLITLIETVWEKYQFLIKQLIVRDFKVKYKRSVLGYLWSFLNPLLTMTVQYIVFSTIFRQGIDNFRVYLLSGIIMYNFFAEAIGQGLNAILANSSLITKVYVPKYIYPVTKVVSCSINLCISLIPLLLVSVITGAPITFAMILVPYALLCLLLFCVGMSLALSSAMVFFRDTQYLWGIASMIWMYATPVFYPESIIPEQFRAILDCNPLYHMIKFIRVILMEGVSPDPLEYLYCLIAAVAACIFGAFVFKKTQDKFVLYI